MFSTKTKLSFAGKSSPFKRSNYDEDDYGCTVFGENIVEPEEKQEELAVLTVLIGYANE